MPQIPAPLASAGARLLTLLDPETAHIQTLRLLKRNLLPANKPTLDDRLNIEVAGLHFPNPLGLAAGFDKNALVPDQLLALGFGFVEVGAVTPRPQPGNERPRVFRLRHNRAVINRYGFNNEGLKVVAERLRARAGKPGIIGANLGANKDSTNRVEDYVEGLLTLESDVAFCTVNISSPNTPGLRALQDRASLDELLRKVIRSRKTDTPVFLKVAPDLTDEDMTDIVKCAVANKIDGLIISNTTIEREGLVSGKFADEKGGLSGAPLFAMSTAVLKDFARELSGSGMPLIGVGGVFSAKDAYRKILSGASLVQLYTALAYEGPGLPAKILSGLVEFLEADGLKNISEAVGADLD